MRNRKHDIEKYLRGELSAAEMHALEKEALNDPFLAEALEGVEQAGADNFLYDLHKLNRSVHERTRRNTRKSKKEISMWAWTSAVAATLLLIAVSGFLVVKILKDEQVQREPGAARDAQPSQDSLAVSSDANPALAQAEPESSAPTTREKKANAPSSQPGERNTNDSTDTLTGKSAGYLAHEAEAENETDALADKNQREAEEEAPAADVSKQDEIAAAERKSGVDEKRKAMAARALGVPTVLVQGKVTDKRGAELPGVNVIVPGSDANTVTDSEGNYQLDVPEGSTLVFNFIGYEAKEITARPDTPLNVALDEDISTLSEIVVIGHSVDANNTRTTFHSAEPNGGKNEFKAYLSNAVKYPQRAIKNKTQGKVTVRFTVEPSGQLTDFEVLKGIGSGCEEELIRAIRQGPYWKPGTRGDQAVPDKVSVRFRFQLPD